MTPACEHFDDAVAESALGLLDPAEDAALLDHAAGCARCRAELDSLVATADRLAALAPHAEPPVGFEQRAIATMARSKRARRRSRTRWRAVAIAVALLLVVGAAALVLTGDDTRPEVVAASLVSPSGRSLGAVVVAPDDGGTTLTMTLAGVAPGRYRCRAVLADGSTVDVAAWSVEREGSDTWAVPLTGDAEAATIVTVVDRHGREVARATLE